MDLSEQPEGRTIAVAKQTGQCPICGTANIVLNDDGTLPAHRVWSIDDEKFVDCWYQGTPR